MNENIKCVQVVFEETPYKYYTFLTNMKKLKENDLVVVDTAIGYRLARVVGYVDIKTVGFNVAKFVVQKVDLRQHEDRERTSLFKEKERQKLAKTIDTLKEQLFEAEALLSTL